MIKNMLMAASKMLEVKPKEDLQLEFAARVACAKTVIDEIVAGMGTQGMLIDPLGQVAPIPVKVQPKQPPSENQLKGKVTVKDGRVATIEGVDLETTIIELDGKQMLCKDAIGKAFQNGRIL